MDSARTKSLPSALATHTSGALMRLTSRSVNPPSAAVPRAGQRSTGPRLAARRGPGGRFRRAGAIRPGARSSELGELGARSAEAPLVGAEIDEHSDSLLHGGDRAEAVLVVSHQVRDLVQHGGLHGNGPVEGATCQLAPGHGAVRSHPYKYAPCRTPTCTKGLQQGPCLTAR